MALQGIIIETTYVCTYVPNFQVLALSLRVLNRRGQFYPLHQQYNELLKSQPRLSPHISGQCSHLIPRENMFSEVIKDFVWNWLRKHYDMITSNNYSLTLLDVTKFFSSDCNSWVLFTKEGSRNTWGRKMIRIVCWWHENIYLYRWYWDHF